MSNQAVKLIISILYSGFVAFNSLDSIYVLPIVYLICIEYNHVLKIFRKVLLLNLFILFLVLFVYVQNPQNALELFLRTNLILMFNITLFYKSKGYDIVRGFDALHFPAKFVSTFYFTISLIEYLLQEFKNIKNTLKVRGFHSKSNLFTYETFGNIFGMMFIKSIKKSQQMQESLITRSFSGNIYLLEHRLVCLKDLFLVLFVVLTILSKVFIL